VIYPIQIRAARALLNLSQHELADLSLVGLATIKRIEAAGSRLTGTAQTLARLQKTLQLSGIEFIEQNGSQGPGVRLRDPLP
jgi:transcriptional regulator with XRE-family HTH domain